MRQTRTLSAVEAATNVSAGLLVSALLTYFVLPVWGLEPSPQAALEITAVYTVASLLRSYLIRRAFA